MDTLPTPTTRKCRSCKKEFESTGLKSCPPCVEKYRKPATVTNNFWQLHPEIAKLVKDTIIKKHPQLTIKSRTEIEIDCKCENSFSISPADFLATGFCPHCKEYLIKLDKQALLNKTIETIKTANSFEEYETLVKACKFSSAELGVIQEAFAKYYFTIHAHLYDIKQYFSYAFDKVDISGLPKKDLGTDAVVIHNDDQVSLIQIKFISKKVCHNRSVFYGMAIDALSINLKQLYLFSNSDSISDTLPEGDKFKYILCDTLRHIDWDFFKYNIPRVQKNKKVKMIAYEPRDWQIEAKKFVKEPVNSTVVAACGAGKTIFSVEVLKENDFKKALVIVPSLQLLSQWFYTLSTHVRCQYLLVGSQGPEDVDDVPYTLTTDPETVANVLKRKEKVVVISTFQSLDLLYAAKHNFSVIFIDEAHLTVGTGHFNIVTKPDFKSEKKIYLTATPKLYMGENVEIIKSMDDEEIYGKQFIYSCRKAIDDDILCDYKILLGIGEIEDGYPAKQRYELYSKFLLKCVEDFGLTKILIASNSHDSSKAFYNEFIKIYKGNTLLMKKNAKVKDKEHALSELEKGCIVFNVRIFNLGVDCPCLEAVFFNGEKSSKIDIVQTAMRCTRKFDGKNVAYVIVPAFIGEDLDVEIGDYPLVRNTLQSLSEKDTAIYEELVDRCKNSIVGKAVKERRIKCINVSTEVEIDLESIGVRIFDRMGRSQGTSNDVRFKMLKTEIIKKDNWVPRNKIIQGINIGAFQVRLKGALTGNTTDYKNDIDRWRPELQELKCWPILKANLDKIVENRNEERIIVTSKEKFKMMITEIQEKNDWVKSDFVKDGVKIGVFQSQIKSVLTGTKNYYEDEMPEWILELEALSCWEKLKSKLTTIQFDPNGKTELLIGLIIENGNFIPNNFIKDDVKIGAFQKRIKVALIGKSDEYKKDLPEIKRRLMELDCWPKLKEHLDQMIANKRPAKTITTVEKLEMWFDLINENGNFILRKCVKNGINIGSFQDSIKSALTGKTNAYKKELPEIRRRLTELPCWPVLKENLDQICTNRKVESKTIIEKLEMLLELINENGNFIPKKFVKDGVKIGEFQSTVKDALTGKSKGYKNELPEFKRRLESLPCWPKLKGNLDKIITNRN